MNFARGTRATRASARHVLSPEVSGAPPPRSAAKPALHTHCKGSIRWLLLLLPLLHSNDELRSPQKRVHYFPAEILGTEPQVRALRSARSPEPPDSSASFRRSWRQRLRGLDGGLRDERTETSLPTETRGLSRYGGRSPRAEEPHSAATGEPRGGWLLSGGGETPDDSAPDGARPAVPVQTLPASAPPSPGQEDLSGSLLSEAGGRRGSLL